MSMLCWHHSRYDWYCLDFSVYIYIILYILHSWSFSARWLQSWSTHMVHDKEKLPRDEIREGSHWSVRTTLQQNMDSTTLCYIPHRCCYRYTFLLCNESSQLRLKLVQAPAWRCHSPDIHIQVRYHGYGYKFCRVSDQVLRNELGWAKPEDFKDRNHQVIENYLFSRYNPKLY